MSNPFETDWSNVHLEQESYLDIIESLSFDTLLLEIGCNIENISTQTVIEQFESDLESRVTEARAIFQSNLNNIVKKAQKERRSQ